MMAKIPTFKTEAEEAQFWETHDSTDYWDDTEEVEIELSPELAQAIGNRYIIRLTPAQRKKLEKIANRKHTDPQKLITGWVTKAIGENR
jgi:hypothetical protein